MVNLLLQTCGLILDYRLRTHRLMGLYTGDYTWDFKVSLRVSLAVFYKVLFRIHSSRTQGSINSASDVISKLTYWMFQCALLLCIRHTIAIQETIFVIAVSLLSLLFRKIMLTTSACAYYRIPAYALIS